MGAALLIAVWLLALGYVFFYHGFLGLSGRQVSLGDVFTGAA